MTNLLVEDFDPEIVPAKFKNPQSGALRVQDLVNSYAELEKKMSAAPTVPTAPEKPEDYCVDCAHGLFQPDEETNKRLHAKGLNQEQVQEVYDLAAEKMVPMVKQVANDFKAERELEKLIEHFGGQEQWNTVSRQLLAFGQKNLPADVLESLSSSYQGILALRGMMKSGEPGLKPKEGGANPADTSALDLQSMMRDPKYWRDKDPAFVSKVTEGFQKVYGK